MKYLLAICLNFPIACHSNMSTVRLFLKRYNIPPPRPARLSDILVTITRKRTNICANLLTRTRMKMIWRTWIENFYRTKFTQVSCIKPSSDKECLPNCQLFSNLCLLSKLTERTLKDQTTGNRNYTSSIRPIFDDLIRTMDKREVTWRTFLDLSKSKLKIKVSDFYNDTSKTRARFTLLATYRFKTNVWNGSTGSLAYYSLAPQVRERTLTPKPKLVLIYRPERIKGLVGSSKCEWIIYLRLLRVEKLAPPGSELATYTDDTFRDINVWSRHINCGNI